MLLSPYEQVIKAGRFRHQMVMADATRRVQKLERTDRIRQAAAQKKRAKAAMVAIDRLQGMSLEELAAKYRENPKTIRQKLAYANQHNLLERYTSATVEKLVPKALAIYDATLSDLYHDVNKVVVEAATRVLEGTGVMGREKAAVLAAPPAQDGEITTLEEYRALRIRRIQGGQSENSGSGERGWGTVLDQHQADPGGDLDGQLPQLPGSGDGGSQDPAGRDPEDPGRGGQVS